MDRLRTFEYEPASIYLIYLPTSITDTVVDRADWFEICVIDLIFPCAIYPCGFFLRYGWGFLNVFLSLSLSLSLSSSCPVGITSFTQGTCTFPRRGPR